MAGSHSRDKGARGERAVIALLKKWLGVEAHRTQSEQSGGYSHQPGDLAGPGEFFKRFHLEVKNDERKSVWSAMEQAMEDKPLAKLPMVFMHRNRSDWLVVMRAEDFLELIGGFKWD
jgi:hypothetical protein